MGAAVDVVLPGGLEAAGDRVSDARVRPLCGHDQEHLAAAAPDLPTSTRDTMILACAVERLGPREPTTTAQLEELTLGDRQILLWTIRRETYGDRIDLVAECAACQSKLDVPVSVTELLAIRSGDLRTDRDETVAGRRVHYRLPTGADQLAIAGTPDTGDALTALIGRLVRTVDGHTPSRDDLDELTAPLSARMAEADPYAETVLAVTCPDCDTQTDAVADAGAILFEEALRGAQWLLDEVHRLAWHYHWRERDILSLPISRRQRYLELVEAAIAGPGR